MPEIRLIQENVQWLLLKETDIMYADFSSGIKSIWTKDREYQTECIRGILTNIRSITEDSITDLHLNYLISQGAFFVHNHEYMKQHFGQFIADSHYGVYTINGACRLAGRLAIPIKLFDDSVCGFIGYSNKPETLNHEDVFVKYLYPPKDTFNKSRYFYITSNEFSKAVSDGYVCIVDGIFDKIILQCMGINAVSLCGSSLTIWHQRYLSFIKHKIVVADNDLAGRRLSSYCRYCLENCVELIQSATGDIDSLIRSCEELNKFKHAFDEMRHEGFLLSKSLTGGTNEG